MEKKLRKILLGLCVLVCGLLGVLSLIAALISLISISLVAEESGFISAWAIIFRLTAMLIFFALAMILLYTAFFMDKIRGIPNADEIIEKLSDEALKELKIMMGPDKA
jgi:hypothetical protein